MSGRILLGAIVACLLAGSATGFAQDKYEAFLRRQQGNFEVELTGFRHRGGLEKLDRTIRGKAVFRFLKGGIIRLELTRREDGKRLAEIVVNLTRNSEELQILMLGEMIDEYLTLHDVNLRRHVGEHDIRLDLPRATSPDDPRLTHPIRLADFDWRYHLRADGGAKVTLQATLASPNHNPNAYHFDLVVNLE